MGEKFRDIDVETVQKLKLKYKNCKLKFDRCSHALTKAQEAGDQGKIAAAQQKKDAALSALTELRNDMKFQVNNLEQKKQVNLLGCMETYCSSYSAFAQAQSNILSNNAIEKEDYVAPSAIDLHGQGMQNGYDDQKDDSPLIPDMDSNGAMPPPPTYADESEQNGYYEQEQEQPNYFDDEPIAQQQQG